MGRAVVSPESLVAPIASEIACGCLRPVFHYLGRTRFFWSLWERRLIIWREMMSDTKFVDPVKDNLRQIVAQGIKIRIDALSVCPMRC
jgi:hypothetical protein